MPCTEKLGRRNCIPIVYVRGTHYEVGFDVGRTFSSIIQSFLLKSGPLNDSYLPAYETKAGRHVYEETLAAVSASYPQYIKELQGTADGAGVPFHKLFLLHMDEIMPNVLKQRSMNGTQPTGCSSICVNQPGQEILGHTEDALNEVMNHYYFVSAHIICNEPQGRWGVTEERFTSLCYAGHLPGYTMNYNHHGLVFSVNTLSAKKLSAGKTPRHFLTRALLSAKNLVQAQQILRDVGCGAGDGCSINMTFLQQEGDRLFHNAEIGPAESGSNESQLSILTISPGEHMYHCNKYIRLPIAEVDEAIIPSSEERMKTFKSYPSPACKHDVIEMLGDNSGEQYCVFRALSPNDYVTTIAVGIFDCIAKTWSLYPDNPKKCDPLVVLPLVLKNRK